MRCSWQKIDAWPRRDYGYRTWPTFHSNYPRGRRFNCHMSVGGNSNDENGPTRRQRKRCDYYAK